MAKAFSNVMLLASLLVFSVLGLFWVFHNHVDVMEEDEGIKRPPARAGLIGVKGVSTKDLSGFHEHIEHAELASHHYNEKKQDHLELKAKRSMVGMHGHGLPPKLDVNRNIPFAELPEYKEDHPRKSKDKDKSKGGAVTGSHTAKIAGDDSTSESIEKQQQQQQQQQQKGGDNSGKRDVIIGMAHEIDPKNLAVFCGSVRDEEVCPDAKKTEVIIFAKEPVPPLYKTIADKYAITLIPFNLHEDFGPQFHQYHPSSLRWALIHDYLEKDGHFNNYHRVWLADARDTWFQRDPFSMLAPNTPGFYAFKGVEQLYIKNCGWNGGWVKDCFGGDELTAIGDNDIICSGVSVGDVTSVMQYLGMMSSLISGTAKKTAASSGGNYVQIAKKARFPRCERNGVDQGVHNVLVHEGVIPNLKVFDHGTGLVSNLQARRSTVVLNKQSVESRRVVSNGKGTPVSVVHQYDRKPELQQVLFEKYVDWVRVGDAQAEWDYEPACSAFTYQADKDYFKKRCDLKMKGGATSAASCCKHCAEAQGCNAFTFYSSVCFLKTCVGPAADAATRGHSAASLAGAVSGWRKG